MTPVLTVAGQSAVTVSPFVSYIPSAATNPLAGFALTFGGTTGLALRSGAEMSISNPPIDSATAGGYRPWGADADAMLFLGGLGGGATVFSRALAPYVFAGIGLTGGDSAGSNVVRNGWSYGVGATIPLGFDADIFAEARWRMSQYVLPTSEGAPDSRSAMRFGLSFHVGGGSSEPSRGAPRPRRRHRIETVEQQDDDVEYVVTPAPASQPIVVVTPAPPPEPQVVIVEPRQPDPTSEVVSVLPPSTEQAPEPVLAASRPSARRPTIGNGRGSQTVVTTAARARTTSRVTVRDSRPSSARPTAANRTVRTRSQAAPGAATTAPRVQARPQARPQARTRTPAAVSRTPAASSRTPSASSRTPVTTSRTKRATTRTAKDPE